MTLVACARPSALVTDARNPVLKAARQREVSRSIDAEKSAVLVTTDEESERFAAESGAASTEVDRHRAALPR